MRLNPDCIRSILLTIEDVTDCQNSFDYCEPNDYPLLSSYPDNEIRYHLKQCELSNLLIGVHYFGKEQISVMYLSPSGHEFLADIRKDTIWNGIKEISTKVGSTSLNALTQIASNVIAELIKAQFGLPT